MLCLDVFGCLFWVCGQIVFLSVFAFLPQLNANREYYAYIESLREHFLCKPNVPAPRAAYREGTLISRTLISSFYCIYIYIYIYIYNILVYIIYIILSHSTQRRIRRNAVKTPNSAFCTFIYVDAEFGVFFKTLKF